MITALFSNDAKYRYWLKAELEPNLTPSLCAFMLNPSVAESMTHGVVRPEGKPS
jgi:hypothetical protein